MNQLIPNEASMLAFGERLAKLFLEKKLESTFTIFLYGPLGAGKTTFARGFLRGLGYLGRVKSPTYALVEPYDLSNIANLSVFHFDFYRLNHTEELELMGIQDYFIPAAVCLIEWPERGAGVLPEPDLSCYFNLEGSAREIKVIADSTNGETILERVPHAN